MLFYSRTRVQGSDLVKVCPSRSLALLFSVSPFLSLVGLTPCFGLALTLVGCSARLLFSHIATDQLEEPALITPCRLLLIEESEIFLIKLGEKLIPGNFFQGILSTITREVNAQYTGFATAFCALNGGGLSAASLRPLP